jgi:hypothetical protein
MVDRLKMALVVSHFVRCVLLSAGIAVGTLCLAAATTPDLVLRGTVNGTQNHQYIEVPFDVPDGIERLTVVFHYTGKEERTTLDLGVESPRGFRGWSGGNKDTFTISSTDATPSYLPGEVSPGRWNILIGIPNIRPKSVSSFEAQIYFDRQVSASSGFIDSPLRKEARWYRGDFHMHTGHSDGRCASLAGKDVPCPVFVTLEAAARRGLDFVAVTDHNTMSQYNALRELQPYFDRLLLIPGREITTFQGHANLFGVTQFVDFRAGWDTVSDMNALRRRAKGMGALVSINHPNAPSGEACMGCGWQPGPPADMSMVSAIEAVNGGAEEGPYSGISFWERQLQAGRRVTAIGGSDNHHPDWPLDQTGSVGSPTTVVYASELSVPAILDAVRMGHVFVDLAGSSGRLLEVTASAGQSNAMRGDVLRAPRGIQVALSVHVAGCRGMLLRVSLDNQMTPPWRLEKVIDDDQHFSFTWPSDERYHWFRADVITSDGKLQLLGNPIYLNQEATSNAGQ